MADKSGLRLIGLLAASLTFAVVIVAAVLVHKTVAGELRLDNAPAITAQR